MRADLAARLLAGEGLEIGALHAPLTVPSHVTVRYVDRMTTMELRNEYPELVDKELVDVEIVDDGEALTLVEDGSQDFIIANHFLEHCEDPIGTIETHLRKLMPGGVLFYAVPDKRFTFDARRSVTPLDHVIRDHEQGPSWSRTDHFEDWSRWVYAHEGEPLRDESTSREHARELEQRDYSIHFHVWTQAELLELFLHCRKRFGEAFDIEVAWRRSIELIVVLRKAGEPTARAGFAGETSADTATDLAAVRSRAKDLESQVKSLSARVERGDRVLASVLNSPSWRLTRPLRAFKRMAGDVLRRSS